MSLRIPIAVLVVVASAAAVMFVPGAGTSATGARHACGGKCLVGQLTPDQVRPLYSGARASQANGRFDGRFTGSAVGGSKVWGKLGSTLSWKLTFAKTSGSATRAELRVGAPRKSGPVIAKLCGPCSNVNRGQLKLTRANFAAMFQTSPLAGSFPLPSYVVVFTAKHPQGELRGQLWNG